MCCLSAPFLSSTFLYTSGAGGLRECISQTPMPLGLLLKHWQEVGKTRSHIFQILMAFSAAAIVIGKYGSTLAMITQFQHQQPSYTQTLGNVIFSFGPQAYGW